jgi:hypothetical protein
MPHLVNFVHFVVKIKVTFLFKKAKIGHRHLILKL